MPALIDLWLMPARLWLDLVAPLKVAPLATDVIPLAKARCIRELHGRVAPFPAAN
jgi:hypothetical protein